MISLCLDTFEWLRLAPRLFQYPKTFSNFLMSLRMSNFIVKIDVHIERGIHPSNKKIPRNYPLFVLKRYTMVASHSKNHCYAIFSYFSFLTTPSPRISGVRITEPIVPLLFCRFDSISKHWSPSEYQFLFARYGHSSAVEIPNKYHSDSNNLIGSTKLKVSLNPSPTECCYLSCKHGHQATQQW